MDAESSTANVIIVGDAAAALRVAPAALDSIAEDARVIRTVLRSEVLHVVRGEPLDLIVAVSAAALLATPEFLAAFAARALPVSLLLIAKQPDEAALERLRAAGVHAEQLVAPVSLEQLRERVRAVLTRRTLTMTTTGVPLPHLVRRIALERGTYILHVNTESGYGSLTFRGGALIDAQSALSTGEPAALEILAWQHASVVFDRLVPRGAPTVTRSLATLLAELDSARTAAAAAGPRRGDLPDRESPSHPEPQRDNRDERKNEKNMANINKTLEEAMKIDGAIGVALADWESGLCLGTAGGGARLNIEVAAAGNCQVVKAKMATMAELGIKGAIQDILITLEDQIHLIRPIKRGENLFLYVAIDKAKGNLGMARHRVQKLEAELNI
ncbi:MAG: DUF4388 domain-containing protein [Nannocystis sp.]|nr:DUF4388 domain-containing protein [Nannocystis sp.]MBA3549829.1 DUF4388 domain-containing protein [Nannocystis sp.]